MPGYPTDNYTSPNDYIQQLSGSGFKIGTGIVLKVMAGDKFNIRASSWYNNGATPGTPVNILNNLVSALCSGVGGITNAAHGATVAQLQTSNVFVPGATNFLNTRSYNSSLPKAYLNWILLDDQFNPVTTYPQSGAIVVGTADVLNTLAYSGIPITKNGFLYIWVSNETQGWDVFFDNLSVKQYSGVITEENHYYLFGLTMAGISSKALNGAPENKYKWNKGSELQNKEFSDGSGLELYETPLRSLDPQLGRWWQIDSKPDYAQSLYSAMGNNPIRYNDPVGDTLPMTYSALKANYPTTGTPKEMYNSVGGQVAKTYNDNEAKDPNNNAYANTCALRMSAALNKSGNDIDTDVKNSKGQKMYTLEGGDGKDYALRKSDIKDYMKGEYGKADISTKSTDKDFDSKVSEIKGQKGVIVFDVIGWGDATGHVTIYDGKGACGHDCYFPDSDKIKQQNTAIQAWNAAHPDEKQKPMVQVTGVSIWIAK